MSSPIQKTLLQPTNLAELEGQVGLDELTSLLDPTTRVGSGKLSINALRRRSGSVVEASESVDVNVKLYMTKIGQVELLSKEREQEIGKEIEIARQGILTTLMSLPYGLRLVIDVQKQLEKELRGPRNTLNADFMSHIKSCLTEEEDTQEFLDFLGERVFDEPTLQTYKKKITPKLPKLLSDPRADEPH
jgi:hypothetical protein